MVNRITQQMLSRSSLEQIQARQSGLFATQRQISSGLRYERASQDSTAAAAAMDLKQAIAFQSRLESNSVLAQDFNNQADAELASATEVMARVRELAIRSATETLNEQQLNGLSAELEGLLNRLGDIGNATHEGNYVFGGFQNTRPPFELKKDLVLAGTNLTELGLSVGTHRTEVETHSVSTSLAGAFALNGGDLIINGVDIGSLTVNDPSRTAAENAETLVELINAKSDESGVSAAAITIPGGSFDAPGGGPLTGIALINRDGDGNTTSVGIKVQGKGVPGVGGLPLLRNENLSLGDTRFTSERVAAGLLAPVPAGTITINGVAVNSAMSFNAANTQEQNAQEIARAINTISTQTEVFAETDGYGYVRLFSQQPFTIAGAPAQTQIPNQIYEQDRDSLASTAAVNTGTALRLSTGSLMLNGVDIFSEPLELGAALTAPQRAQAVAVAINKRANDSGISAYADAAGQLHFNNADRHLTEIAYRGDAGDNQAQIGSNSLLPLYMSGDQAFAGHRRDGTLLSAFDLPAAGLGSATSSANVSFAAGDSLAAGDFVLNGVDILVPAFAGNAVADATTLMNAINAQSASSNVSATVTGGQVTLQSTDGNLFSLATANDGVLAQIPAASYLNPLAAGDFLINGVDIGPIPAVPANPSNPPQNMLDLGQALATAINAQSPLTGVSAEARQDSTGGVRLLLSAQGQDIQIDSNNALANTLLSATGLAPGTLVDQQIDVFASVMNLRDQVINSKYSRNTAETISTQTLKEVSDAIDRLDDNRVELGVRVQRAELVENRVVQTRELLTSQLADNREIDMTEAISRLTQEENALEAAYAVTQRISSLSLLNFI